MGLDNNRFDIKKSLFSGINRKLTLLFVIVALLAPIIAVSYLYSIMEPLAEQNVLLQTIIVIVIIV